VSTIAPTKQQGIASQFGATCINDARARLLYARDIAAVPGELRAAINAGSISVSDAAAQAVALRNRIMELARRRSSPTARAYAMRLKRDGRSVSELSEKYAQRLYGSTFSALSERRRASVFKEIIRASARPDEGVMRLGTRHGLREIRAYLERERTGLSRLLKHLITPRTLPDVATRPARQSQLLAFNHDAVAPTTASHSQPSFTIKAMRALVIRVNSFALHECMQPPVTEPAALMLQFHQARRQHFVLVLRLRLVMQHAAR